MTRSRTAEPAPAPAGRHDDGVPVELEPFIEAWANAVYVVMRAAEQQRPHEQSSTDTTRADERERSARCA